MAKAFRCLLHELLGNYGLVVLDANGPLLKQHFKHVIKDELLNQNSIKLLNDEKWLSNFENNQLQITPREINLFYLDNNKRERIVFESENWKVNNTDLKFSKTEIENLVETNPEKFSPNVVLRALYQNIILPDVAFVGGGSELTYWMQLKVVFDYYKIDFPQVYLRDSIFWMDEQAEEKRLKWNFEMADIFKNINDLINDFTGKNGGLNIDWEIENVKLKVTELNEKIKWHDKTYEPISMAVVTQINNQLENLQKKILQADKKKISDAIQQIQKWKEKLLPQNQLHERQDNFISYYLRHGNQFVETLMVHLNPQNTNLKVFTHH
jgi:bacillithiol biosynthesis cysteine-adding enzyme BshC